LSFSSQLSFLTFLVLCDDWIAELDELSSSDLVDSLDSEVIFSIGDEVLDGPAHLVLPGHHVDVRPPASLTALHAHTTSEISEFVSLVSDLKLEMKTCCRLRPAGRSEESGCRRHSLEDPRTSYRSSL